MAIRMNFAAAEKKFGIRIKIGNQAVKLRATEGTAEFGRAVKRLLARPGSKPTRD